MTDDVGSSYRQWWSAMPALFAALQPLLMPDGAVPSPGSDANPMLGAWTRWATPLFFAATGMPDAANPMQVGADRTFGAFADALGVRPMREIQEAWQMLAKAEMERRSAQAGYAAMLGQAFADGTGALAGRLEEMRRNGEEVTSLLAFVRLWTREADAALHARMQSPQGLDMTARVVRASTRQRAELHRLVALISRNVNVPTREEVDDGFREIQELKREIRRLRKELPAAKAVPSADAAGPPAKAASRRKSAVAKRAAAGDGAAKSRRERA
jgi:hypothetical protein